MRILQKSTIYVMSLSVLGYSSLVGYSKILNESELRCSMGQCGTCWGPQMCSNIVYHPEIECYVQCDDDTEDYVEIYSFEDPDLDCGSCDNFGIDCGLMYYCLLPIGINEIGYDTFLVGGCEGCDHMTNQTDVCP